MGQEEYPLIDGEYPSWANIVASLEIYDGPSIETRDWTKIDFSDKLEPGAIRGTGPRKRARTVGEYDADATIGLYIDAARRFMKALAAAATAKGISGIGRVVFDVKLQYAPLSTSTEDNQADGDGNSPIIEVDIIGCRIKTRSGSNASSADGSSIEFPLDVMDIKIDGVSLV